MVLRRDGLGTGPPPPLSSLGPGTILGPGSGESVGGALGMGK